MPAYQLTSWLGTSVKNSGQEGPDFKAHPRPLDLFPLSAPEKGHMILGFISTDLGDLTLWACLIAMFIIVAIMVHVYVPGEKNGEKKR